jgi:hypothetical protein
VVWARLWASSHHAVGRPVECKEGVQDEMCG